CVGDEPRRSRPCSRSRHHPAELDSCPQWRCALPRGCRTEGCGMTVTLRALFSGCWLVLAAGLGAAAQQPFITVASTTSTEESGLFGYLLPAFTKASGIQVRVVAVGTGQALKIGEHGDCDVLFVHDRPAELAFVARGFRIDRHDVMYKDFILGGR